MKRLPSSFKSATQCVLLLLCFCLVSTQAHAGFSDSIALERYTLVDGDTFQYDTGYLHSDGTFEAITSLDLSYSMFGMSPDYIAPFSGKPMMNEDLYNAYNSRGLISNWIRSEADYYIGFAYYVAVAVKGKGDPNPTITINTQPESQVVAAGDWTFFYVDAEPAASLTYQWKFKGKDLPGQTDFMLTLTNITPAQAGIYTVALSTGGKPILTKPALLKVDKPVVIKTEPKSQTVKAGKAAVFRVGVSGSAPFQYQWYFNYQAITNATKPVYAIPHVGSTNAGTYVVIVSNPVSDTYSEGATLSVSP